MFDIKNKETDEIIKVFSVKEDTNGITRFLIYKNDKWIWVQSENYEPVFVVLEKLIEEMYSKNISLLAEVQKEINEILIKEGEDNA